MLIAALFIYNSQNKEGFLGGTSSKEPACQCSRPKRCRFDPWVRKNPWRRAWEPTTVFLPRESPSTEEPSGLQSVGSQRVGHDWVTKAQHSIPRGKRVTTNLDLAMHWRRKWQPTPVFLPGESQGWLSLVGCHLWGHTELDMTEVTWQQQNPHSSWLFLFSPPGRQVFTLWPQHGCHTSPDLTSSSSRSADHTYGGLCLSLRSLNNTM